MTLDPASKIRLNKITHTVRAAQAVLQYGVGAMIDFPDQTLMTAAPEYWAEKTVRIHDERLEKLLNVDYFGMPGGKDEIQYEEGISYVRFPEWYFCPKCRKFQPIQKWIEEYRNKATAKILDYDPHMVKHMRCSTCMQDLVVARIIAICEQGHIDDFPWIQWVHKKNMGGEKHVCSNPKLTFKTGASSTEGLEGLVITCENCNARATLKDAFDPNIFQRLGILCNGRHPWKNTYEACEKFPRSMQRGSSSVYFPITASSLIIPPYSDAINKKVEGSNAFQACRTTLSNIPHELRAPIIQAQIDEWTKNISIEIGNRPELIKTILERKWLDVSEDKYSTSSVEYRAEEYDALNGTVKLDAASAHDFLRESVDIKQYNIPYIKCVSLIHKIREVQAMIGYSRLAPIEWNGNLYDKTEFVSVKQEKTNWYPAYEVRGEGIFIEFEQSIINNWISGNDFLMERVDLLNENYKNSFIGRNRERTITPKFLLLHTLSHLLIKQLSFDCGYNIASLKERIYCSDTEDGKEMAGILIYTASGDSEGTLGGLVRQGRPDCLGRTFEKAIKSAAACSNDPVCILSKGQGRDSLNLAACYACALIPETSCEEYNIFLDRATVTGTFEDRNLGFYSKKIFNINHADLNNRKEVSKPNNKEESYNNYADLVLLKGLGLDMSGMNYDEIWEYIIEDELNIREKEFLTEMISQSDKLSGCKKPLYGETVYLIATNKDIKPDLLWPNSNLMLFLSDNIDDYKAAKLYGIKCININDENMDTGILINLIKEKN